MFERNLYVHQPRPNRQTHGGFPAAFLAMQKKAKHIQRLSVLSDNGRVYVFMHFNVVKTYVCSDVQSAKPKKRMAQKG
jgi:hypothetical protein